MRNRLLSLAMALCMVLTLLPATVFAEETVETPACVCGAICAEDAMDTDCPVCGAEGAVLEDCGKYTAPAEQTAIEKVQALIDALPDADTITEENRADVEAQLTAIDEAKFPLEDECDALDFTKYNDAIAALNELDGMGGAEIPEATAEATAESYFVFDKNTGTITGVTDKSLIKIVIPDTIDGVAVTTIGKQAFAACKSLESVTIPSSVTSIGAGAFVFCESLTSITIPSSITSIGRGAFGGCLSLTQINVDGENEAYASIDGVLYNKNASEILSVPGGRRGTFNIPNSVTLIGDSAFYHCDKLTSIIIPSSVTSIERYAFSLCKSLRSITIPNGVTSIKEAAFQSCPSLTHITIPNSVTSIERYSFAGCNSLTDVYYLGTQDQWNTLSSNIGAYNDAINGKVKCIPITYTAPANFVYDGKQKVFTVTKLDDSFSDFFVNYTDSDGNPNSGVAPLYAGTYTVFLSYMTDIGDFDLLEFTITPATLSANDFRFTPPSNLTYDGNSKSATVEWTTTMATGVSGLGDITVKYYDVDGTPLADTPKNVGTYIVKIDVAAGRNNFAATDVTDAEWKFEITKDRTAPTGKITLGTNSWNTFLNNISFGLFFKDTQEVAITATDNSGENVKIEYLLSDKELTADELATATFTVYNDKFTVEPNNAYVIYAKLTDNSGNVTYINSNGIVLDNVAPTISGIENGKTYCEAQTVTVTDGNGIASVTVNGTPVTLDANGQFTLSSASGTQTVIATDKAGNVSAEMIVTVNDGHETDTPATCTEKAVCKHCGTEYGEVDSSNHALEHNQENAATVTATGNSEYWHCKDCDKYFSDKDGQNEIDLKDTVLSKLPPQIIEGSGQRVTAGEKKELTFRSNAAFSDFIRVEVDGKTIDEKDYTVKEGSTIVTLKADYVATLSAGEHTLGIVSESGTATTTFIVDEKVADDSTSSTTDEKEADDSISPKTGDQSNMALWFALLLISGGLLTGIGIYSKKKKDTV